MPPTMVTFVTQLCHLGRRVLFCDDCGCDYYGELCPSELCASTLVLQAKKNV
jgi:hypothetical protein